MKINVRSWIFQIIAILTDNGINKKFIKDFSDNIKRLTLIGRIYQTMGIENDIEHTLNIMKLSFNIIKSKPYINVNEQDKINLFYACLFHDLDKSKDTAVSNFCFPDNCPDCKGIHGFGSSNYLKKRVKNLNLLSKNCLCLKGSDLNKICGLIRFHYLRFIDTTSFNQGIEWKDLFLCLVFWLADNADASGFRTLDFILPQDYLNDKQIARRKIESIEFIDNQIIWKLSESISRREKKIIELAVKLTNDEIRQKNSILFAYNLPTQVVLVRYNENIPFKNSRLSLHEIFEMGLTNNCFFNSNQSWIFICEDSLKKAYHQIRYTFSEITVTSQPESRNYSGPIGIEIRDIKDEDEDDFWIHNDNNLTLNQLRDYAEQFLDPDLDVSKYFYYGYTHGQRIQKCRYPYKTTDIDDKKTFLDGSGVISQLDTVVEALKSQKENARRAYVIIANPLYDNPKSKWLEQFEKLKGEQYVGPSLVSIHFRIEPGDKISAFAYFRSQEMSTFFIVNYFELKHLINTICEKLNRKCKRTRNKFSYGRIVMISTLSYFHPHTSLLDKPKISKIGYVGELKRIIENLNTNSVKKEFIDMLKEVRDKTFLVLDYEWCDEILADNDLNSSYYFELKKKVKRVKEKFFKLQMEIDAERLSRTSKVVLQSRKKVLNNLIGVV